MQIPRTKFVVADNSGAKSATCISTLKGQDVSAGNLIVVVAHQCRPGGAVKEGQVCLALVVRTVKNIKNGFGFLVSFSDNAVVLLGKDLKMIGTRVFGPISSSFKNNENYNKIVSLASEVI